MGIVNRAERRGSSLSVGVASYSGSLYFTCPGPDLSCSFMPTFSMPSGASQLPQLSSALNPLPVLSSGVALPTSVETGTTPPIPGLPPMPQKLIKKILACEFVEMSELLPDSWRVDDTAKDSCCRSVRPRRVLITDIALWAECYAM